METIKKLSDIEIDEIINGSVDGVYPTSQEVSMATELKTRRDILATEEPDYIRYSCGCCGYESLSPFSVCPTCNFDNTEETPLFMRPVPLMPAGLHPYTQKLVADFSAALAGKLHKAQLKYGYSDEWKRDDWANECLAHFQQHIAKGDPRDVAAYCAFMWFHGWETELPTPSIPVVPDEVDANDEMFRKLNARECVIAARWWNACRTAMLSTTTGEGHEKPSA